MAELEKKDNTILSNPASFSSLYHSYEQRNNVICWFPFEANKKILNYGYQNEANVDYFVSKKLEVYNIIKEEQFNNLKKRNKEQKNVSYFLLSEESFINDFNEKVDYIFLPDAFAFAKNAEALLKKCKSILNENGYILITGFNQCGISSIAGNVDLYSGIPYGNFLNDSVFYMNKNDYEDLFRKCDMENIRFYYPYPDHLFTETLFSDRCLPKVGELTNNSRIYGNYRLQMFNETSAYNALIKGNKFCDFTNSFLIVIGKNSDTLCKYVKISNERNADYQIYTTISNDNCVEKHSYSDASVTHLNTIVNYYRNYPKDALARWKVKYCESYAKAKAVAFEFVNGISLEEMLYRDSLQSEDDIISYIDVVNKILSCNPQTTFTMSSDFKTIFGYYEELEGLPSSLNSNIDLIFDNIIMDANGWYSIIDYEWTYSFAIPNQFILFRTIFHSRFINQLAEEEVKKLYLHYGIDDNLYSVFFQMEVHFQNFVSSKGRKLMDKTEEYTNCLIESSQMNPLSFVKYLTIKDAKDKVIESFCFNTNHVLHTFSLKNGTTDKIKIYLNSGYTIVNIKQITLNGETEGKMIRNFKSNASLIKGTTYFFEKDPWIEVSIEKIGTITVEFDFYYTNDATAADIFHLHDQITDMEQKMNHINHNFFVRVLRKLKLLKY